MKTDRRTVFLKGWEQFVPFFAPSQVVFFLFFIFHGNLVFSFTYELNINFISVHKIPENDAIPHRIAPPASKEVVAKLPVITVTEEILSKLGKEAECAICKENLVVSDQMQELPCKHTFHPPCLKPWLVILLYFIDGDFIKILKLFLPLLLDLL